MSEPAPPRAGNRIADYVVVSVLDEPGYTVLIRYETHPNHWRKVGWFPTKDRAESYAEIENIGLDDLNGWPSETYPPEEKDELPDLPMPQSVVVPELFKAASPKIVEPPPEPAQTTMTEEITETTRHEYRSIAGPMPAGGPIRLTAPQGAVLRALVKLLPSHSGHASFKDIAHASETALGSVSAHIDALEKKGVVRREGEIGTPAYEIDLMPNDDRIEIEPAAVWPEERARKLPPSAIAAPTREQLMGKR